ncbi:MAG: glycosyl hydrolase family 28-related protein [Oscillospiraceae bacterium]|nr:glycosyl hydrolase family 28-related protein [Oscillospiraceae bacterium]
MNTCNIMHFGAKGDGIADDTAALEQALEAARETGCLEIPAGTYRIRPVRIPGHITIRGNASWGYSAWGYENNKKKEGPPTDPMINGNTVFIPASTDGEALWDLTGACGTRIIGLSFDGLLMGDQFHGLLAKASGCVQNLVLEDVRVCHFSGGGLKFSGARSFALRRSLIISNTGHALEVTDAHDGSIIDNQLAYNGGAGFFGSGGEGFLITANRIEGGDPGGVYLENASSVTMNGNSFDSCRGPAITLLGCTSCAAAGNMARLCGRIHTDDGNTLFRLERCRGLTVTGNSLWGWPRLAGYERMTWYGMVVRELEDAVIAQNTLQDPSNRELIRDYGGHVRTLIDQNMGRVYDPASGEKTYG